MTLINQGFHLTYVKRQHYILLSVILQGEKEQSNFASTLFKLEERHIALHKLAYLRLEGTKINMD